MTSKRQRTATLPTLESPTATSGARETATASAHALTPAELDEYHREGFFIRKALFSTEEAAEVLSCAQSDSTVLSKAHGRMDSDGFISKLSLWNTCGVNIYGALARSARVIDSVEQILGGMTHGFGGTEEAYHYHTKVMIKEARVGGKWEWHQDYGCMHHWGSNPFDEPGHCLSATAAYNLVYRAIVYGAIESRRRGQTGIPTACLLRRCSP